METVLVVDDEASIADMLAHVVTGMGFRVLVAYDGDAALRLARTAPVDVVLSDVMLPGLSGPALVAALQDAHAGAVPRFVLMSSLPERHVRAAVQGDYRFLQKPFALPALAAALQAAVGHGISVPRRA